MSASTISATDIEVFKRLSNPAVVDVQVESRTRRATAEMRQALEKAATVAAAAPPDPPPSPVDARPKAEPASPAASSASSARAERARSSFRVAQEEAAAEQRREEERAAASRAAAQVRSAPAAVPPAEVPRTTPPAPRPAVPAPRPAVPVIPEDESGDDDGDEEEDEVPEPQRRCRGSEEDRLEKQGFLIELSNMKQKGVVLSRDFSMRDSVAELEFEVQKQNNNITTRHNVTFMRDMMRIVINGIEIGNNRFGPFLSIDGWAENVTQDMSKYEHALERIYKRYCRKSQLSPIMELAWLLVGSMVAWHFKSKFFGPPSCAAAASRQPPPKSGTAASAPPPPRAAASGTRGRPGQARPVLRPPSALFGL